jgi:hypothetical protein
MIRLTTIQCIHPSFDINRFITLIANAKYSLVATIAYINSPIVFYMEFLSFHVNARRITPPKIMPNKVFTLSGVAMSLQFPMPKRSKMVLILFH